MNASAQGYHQHKGADFDTALDDFSGRALDRDRSFLTAFHQRLVQVDTAALTPEDHADYDIIENQIALSLFDIDVERTAAHNPTMYIELIGSALFNPYMLNYAPKELRAKHIIARLEKLPAFCEQARRNLTNAPAIWIKVALEENTRQHHACGKNAPWVCAG